MRPLAGPAGANIFLVWVILKWPRAGRLIILVGIPPREEPPVPFEVTPVTIRKTTNAQEKRHAPSCHATHAGGVALPFLPVSLLLLLPVRLLCPVWTPASHAENALELAHVDGGHRHAVRRGAAEPKGGRGAAPDPLQLLLEAGWRCSATEMAPAKRSGVSPSTYFEIMRPPS